MGMFGANGLRYYRRQLVRQRAAEANERYFVPSALLRTAGNITLIGYNYVVVLFL